MLHLHKEYEAEVSGQIILPVPVPLTSHLLMSLSSSLHDGHAEACMIQQSSDGAVGKTPSGDKTDRTKTKTETNKECWVLTCRKKDSTWLQ